jgi:preprotein translocase subunit SecA
MSADQPPPARPAAAAASAALARATGSGARVPLSPMLQPSITNVVESSAAGKRSAAANGNGAADAAAAGRRKVGRNEPCPCGSGRKYKVCHGR